ncbi:50S ribosomal protein L30e-like protein [Schizophyllum amplum]|uniref:50S ribosomal protein L30e-like protein n=1 Tax=Schizophyllum amplum TaxID=97359 RepID=A0A550C4Y2_9AGAR|nr:50S ribosomal protein L30e-like protein [Auriculariopsis ampla]
MRGDEHVAQDQIARASAMLTQEYGTASNIKSRVNRLSVLAAITSTQQRLKLYNRVPPNGLVCSRRRSRSTLSPTSRSIRASLYLCDNKFHTEALQELLESDSRFGFIVMDGNGTLFGTLAGNTREVIHKFTRHNYVRKVAEHAVQHFITNDKVNVSGLVLAGSADFKTELSQSDMFDPRLVAKVIKVVDVSYGGENGFNQAIELAAESLANVKFDTGKYCFGVEDTLKALELGAVETLIEITVHANKEQEKDREKFMDKSTGLEMEQVEEPQALLEWFAEKYREFGANLEFVTNRSQEGAQFVKGFGGIGGLLRYKVDLDSLQTVDDEEEDEFYSDDEDI